MADKWVVEPNTRDVYGEVQYCPLGIFSAQAPHMQIATVMGDVPELDAEANARLIAAAPELLAALIACRDELAVMLRRHNDQDENDGSWRYDGQTISEADAVILKARGES